MNQISCCDWRNPSGQDGAILPARHFSLGPPRSKIIFWCFIHYNKSFIDQACSVKLAGHWPRSFFPCLRTSTHKHAKKELGQYPAILMTSRLVNNPYIVFIYINFNYLYPSVLVIVHKTHKVQIILLYCTRVRLTIGGVSHRYRS